MKNFAELSLTWSEKAWGELTSSAQLAHLISPIWADIFEVFLAKMANLVVGRVRDQKSIFGHAVTKIGHESARIFLKNLNFRFRVKIWYGLQTAFNAPKTCYKRYFNEKNN